MSASCESCGAEITWARTESQRPIPLDAEPLDVAAAGLVALNPRRGSCRVIAAEDLPHVEAWLAKGVTIHRAHFATCPSAAQHRVSPQQEALPL